MVKIFVINDSELSSVENLTFEKDDSLSKCNEEIEKSQIKKSNNIFVRDGDENPIAVDEIPNDDTGKEIQENSPVSLEDQKKLYQERTTKREERFECIILNKQVEFSWVVFLSCLFGITLIGFVSTTPITLVPAHDLILFPEYWFEVLFHGLIFLTAQNLYMCFVNESVLNVSYNIEKRNIVQLVLIGMAASTTLMLALYYIWTYHLEYQFPMPFLGLILVSSMMFIFLPILWFKLPPEWRENSKLQRRMMLFAFLTILNPVVDFGYTLILENIRNAENQHFVALALPVMREINLWIALKLIDYCYNEDDWGTKIFFQYEISTKYAVLLCYVIGSFATDTTSWLLMSVDFLLNIFLCLWIVWSRKRHPDKMQKQIVSLQELAVYELSEFHAPLSFILVITTAFYGPNAGIIGNVGNSYWAFSEIQDIYKTLGSMGFFFLVDFSSTLVCATILWFTCQINLWKVFHGILKEFGKSFSIVQIFFLVVVSNYIEISLVN